MPTAMIQATYKDGLVRPSKKLPFREGAVLKLTIHPLTRTQGVSPIKSRAAQAIIYVDEM